jgi:hypothetical protein
MPPAILTSGVGGEFFRWRLGQSLGVTLLVASLGRYTSQHHSILGRWSPTYFGVLLVGSAIAAALWSRSWRRAHSEVATPTLPSRLLDLAILTWGLAALVAAIGAPAHASDLLDGNVLGFEVPASTLIGWLPVALIAGAALSQRRVLQLVTKKPWLLSLVTLLVVLVLAEGLARAWAVVKPQVQAFPTHRTAMWLNRYAPLNSQGFRDREHINPKTRRRLLVVGDSYAYGWGIANPSDRLSDMLAATLDSVTHVKWEPFNVSRPDLDTKQETELVASIPEVRPDIALVLYVFNDIEYLAPMTERRAITEAAGSLRARLNPARLLFQNSFLAQELYVRARHARLYLSSAAPAADIYSDSALVAKHLKDLCRLVRTAAGKAKVAAVVPLDIAPVVSPAYQRRMETFTRQAESAGIPVMRVDTAFVGQQFSDLVVNSLDAHPNELANWLATRALAEQLLPVLGRRRPADPVTCRE